MPTVEEHFEQIRKERLRRATNPTDPEDRPNAFLLNAGLSKPSLAKSAFETLTGVLGFAVEKIQRPQRAGFATLLFANRNYTLDEWKDEVGKAFSGRSELDGWDWARLMMGNENWQALQNMSVPVPKWVAAFASPEMAAIDSKHPSLSIANVIGLGSEMFVADPFVVAALTPKALGIGVTKGIEKLLPGPGKKAWRTFFTPEGEIGGIFNFVRQPQDWMTGRLKPAYEGLVGAEHATKQAYHDFLKRIQILKRDNQHLWKVRSRFAKRHSADLDFDQRIGAYLDKRKVKFSEAEKPLVKQVESLVDDLKTQLLAADPSLKDLLDAPLLSGMMPRLAGKRTIPLDIWQSWNERHLGHVFVGLSKKQYIKAAAEKGLAPQTIRRKLRFPIRDYSGDRMLHDFSYATARKIHLEPELLKWRPHRRKNRALEHPAVYGAGVWQRRALVDLINVFTGNARGRKMIQLDLVMQKVAEDLAKSPAGKRVARLLEFLGGRTTEGLIMPSPSAYMAGIMTRTIIGNTLGGSLKSTFRNLTQISNFSITDGMPAVFKGAIKMGDPQYKTARKHINLLEDYKQIFADETWAQAGVRKWFDVIMTPFNMAEGLIRGIGFNIGLDDAVRATGKTLNEVMGDPKLLREAAEKAHLKSIDGAFSYGIMGRPVAFAGMPFVRPFITLMSFPYKQAEFLRRSFVADGGSFVRWMGLHGWLIEQLDERVGVNAEDWLGWGFLPPTRDWGGVPLFMNPVGETLLESFRALAAYHNDDLEQAERSLKKVGERMQLIATGIPVPSRTLNDLNKLRQEVTTLQHKIGPEKFVQTSVGDAIKRFAIGGLSTDVERRQLRLKEAKGQRRFDYIMDKRVNKVIDATIGMKADELMPAMWELQSGIEIEGVMIYPTEEQVDDRLESRMRDRLVSQDVLEVMQSGFLKRVFLNARLELLKRTGGTQ